MAWPPAQAWGPLSLVGVGEPLPAVKGGAACWPPRKDLAWFPGTPRPACGVSCFLRAPGKQTAGAQSRAAGRVPREACSGGQGALVLRAKNRGGRTGPESHPGMGSGSRGVGRRRLRSWAQIWAQLGLLAALGRWRDSGALLQTALEPGSGPCLTWGRGAGRLQVSPRIRQRCAQVGSMRPGPWVQVPTEAQTPGGSGPPGAKVAWPAQR